MRLDKNTSEAQIKLSMNEGYENSAKFIVYTLRIAFLDGEKKLESFDEDIPVWQQIEDEDNKEFEFRYGLLSWSLQHAIKVDPDEHMNQSLREMATILVQRDRLGEQEYKSYRKWVYEEMSKLKIAVDENGPTQDERDKNAYLKSKN